jgi:uncharacterized protein
MTILIQFAKPFELGHVKTRIATTLGDEKALIIHKKLCLSVNRQLNAWCENANPISDRNNSEVWLSAPQTTFDGEELNEQFCTAGLLYDSLVPQQGKDLGERMTNAASLGLKKSPSVFIVGSDFPVLDNSYLDEALSALALNDIVLGPSEDGGYGLIGFRSITNLSLLGLDWGTNAALTQTVARIEASGLAYHLLPVRFDVDLEADYQRWQTSRWYPQD